MDSVILPQPGPGETVQGYGPRLTQALQQAMAADKVSYTGMLGEFLLVPSGWLPTDGSALDVASYPDLANLLSGSFGPVDPGGGGPNGTIHLPNITSSHTGFTMAIKA